MASAQAICRRVLFREGLEAGLFWQTVRVVPVLTAEQSAAQDATAKTPIDVLMERAGLAVALAAVRSGATYGSRVAVLAGPGNNGGDGYVAAVHLAARGASVTVHQFAEPRSRLVRDMCARATRSGVRMRSWDTPVGADLVIDAVFGGGFRGTLPNLAGRRGLGGPVIAVDVASGLSATTGIADPTTLPAERTVTFHGPKVGHLIGDGPDVSGVIDVVDIGLPEVTPEFWLCEKVDAPLPRRPRSAHKWSSGAVLVVGGSGGIGGAAHLAARSVLTAGAAR